MSTHRINRVLDFKSYSYFIVACAAVLLTLQTTILAAPSNKEIVFSFNPEGWPPYLINDEQISSSGIMIDVLQTVAKKYGYKVIIKHYPEKRGRLYLTEGKVDIFPKAKEWTKDPDKYLWSDVVVTCEDVFTFMRSKPFNFSSPDDLIGKTVGTVLGYHYPLLNPYFEDKRILRDDSYSDQNIFKKLLKNRYDVGIINKNVALWIIANEPEFQGKFDFSDKYVGSAGYRFMFTAKHDWRPFIEKFNYELEKMKHDGRLEKILKAYR